ncbi:MAG TPA: fluoride efflux transporter CrcB [Xanthobacteraceae bacterium]|jgi:CrcB protein|nr:fluoride efflux transporter CrcB [Xanthobacteraceae bacterium]
MLAVTLVFIGGGLGAVARHGVNILCARLFGLDFPWGTFAVNLIGSFAIGWLAAYFAFRAGADWTQSARLFLITGILGGFTTFSSFSLDFAMLFERSAFVPAMLYVAGSVGISLAAIFLGLYVGRAIG